ncbi:tRNA uridine-5-carboxymethylaminomethyl(34) synthesis GTPase MnmE [Oscillospiraceae bacterium HV4-5-C5C]|nr:tRNA uridine-5-carboxymethylaminomethyl(34) synthesis GTPase MnmE [Oscillospiraceae bacterium HV4-5-C5C]
MSYSTIAAFATPAGQSGLAVLRLSGPEALSIAEAVFTRGPLPGRQVQMAADKTAGSAEPAAQSDRFSVGRIVTKPLSQLRGYEACLGYLHYPGADSQSVIDQAIALRFIAPHSYTGEDVFEFSLHGGWLARQEVLEAVLQAGAEAAGPGEFTKRAFLNGRMDLTQAESVMDLIEADSRQQADLALSNLNGQLSARLQRLRKQLLQLMGDLEIDIEYPEYDDFRYHKAGLLQTLSQIDQSLGELEDSYRQGRLIKEGVKVVLAGRPNAGKSSLLNYLTSSEKAIVTEIPGTTRDVMEAAFSLDGFALRLFDTAGIRVSQDPVEKIGIERARDSLKQADIVLWLLEEIPAAGPGRDPVDLPNAEEAALIGPDKPVVLLLTKTDQRAAGLLNQEWQPAVVQLQDQLRKQGVRLAGTVQLSVRTGEGIRQLRLILSDLCQQLLARGAPGADLQQAALLTRERQVQSVREARGYINTVLKQAELLPMDILAQQLRLAADALAALTGDQVSDSLLNDIFSRFCVGK